MAKFRRFLRPPRQEQGQAMVFVVLFLPVVVLSLVFLYKAGRITSEKMELQNAADAAAFSVAVVEARDLNYMAYTNRAMVANEVAIGQLVGLASWARHWRSFSDYIRAYNRLVLAPITFGVSTPIVEAFTAITFQAPGTVLSTVFGTIAKVGSQVLSMINKIFGASQTGFHIVSILYAVSTLEDIIDRNAPDAQLSPFGLLALLAHAYTFGVIPGVDLTSLGLPEPMIKTYSTTSVEPGDQEGMQRFAAITNQSRDEFTTKRGWEWPLVLLDIDESICFPPCGSALYFQLDLRIYFDFELRRLGGSELRYVGADAAGNKFNWSGADNTDVGVNIIFDVSAKAVIDLDILGTFEIDLGGIDLNFGSGKASLDVCIPIPIPGFGCIDFTLVPEIDFPTSLPFSAGAYQTAPTAAQYSLARNIFSDTAPLYGDAPSNFLAWKTGIPPDVAGIASLGPIPGHMYQATNMASTYKGIPKYNENNFIDDPWGFQAPYILIGLTKDLDPIRDNDRMYRAGGLEGRLEANYTDEVDELGVLAKAELYFARPNDLSYFQRADGYQEYGNAFNP
ncbi:MAG TPA: pilus assembly protein TadG-related protein, partial [Gammaproteobacteria bacterium]